MRLNMVIELLDVPGQLVSALSYISDLGVNLVTVIHRRENKTEGGVIPVQITIEGAAETLELVTQELEKNGFKIVEIDGVIRRETITAILIGDIIDNDVRDTVDQINELKDTYVADLALRINEEPSSSSARIAVKTEFGKRKIVLDKIREIANRKDFLVINEV